jgi:predicted nucleic acid-binding protein
MARYMLDTDTCSYIMKRSHPAVVRFQSVPVADVCMGGKAELLYGVEVSPRRAGRRPRRVPALRGSPRLHG